MGVKLNYQQQYIVVVSQIGSRSNTTTFERIEFHRHQARNAAAIFSTASVKRAASKFASVMFFSKVIASVRPGNVVAPYPVASRLASASNNSIVGTHTEPLARGNSQVSVPFTVLYTFLMNKSTLE